mgnify:CR=1 FL=1
MTKIDCSKVYVDCSSFSSEDNVFDGAFANEDIKNGDLVEKGLMRRLSTNENKAFDGMKNSHVFTWSDDIPNYTWAYPSGCATFYNSRLAGQVNTRMVRFFDEDRFEIYAIKNIEKNDELTHTYKSLEWRSVFAPLFKNLTDNNTLDVSKHQHDGPVNEEQKRQAALNLKFALEQAEHDHDAAVALENTDTNSIL